MNELERIFGPAAVAALEGMVDRRLQLALAEFELDRDGSPWLSEGQAADYLGVSRRTVQRMVAKSRVRSTTIGRRRLLHRDDLDRAVAGEEKREPLHPATME